MGEFSASKGPGLASGCLKPVPLLIMIAVLAVLLCVILAGNLDEPPNGARVVYFAIAAAALAAVFGEVSVQGLIGLFSPFSATMAGFVWFFCAGPVFKPEMNAYLYVDAGVYLPLAALVGTGMFFFTLGYYGPSPRPRLRHLFQRVENLSLRLDASNLLRLEILLTLGLLTLLTIVSVLIRENPIRFLTESMYGLATAPQRAIAHPIARYFYQAHRTFLICVSGIAALHFSSTRAGGLGRLFSLGVFFLAGALSAARGSRSILLYSAGSGLLLVILRVLPVRRQPGKQSPNWGRALVAFLAFILLGATALLLVELRRGGGPFDRSFANQPVEITRLIDYGADMNRTLRASLEMIPKSQPHLWGATYLAVFTLFIPRRWWPDKPQPLGSLIAAESGFSNENVSFSNLGELYANFGYLGVFVGMWLTGVFFAVCWKMFIAHREQAVVLLFYCLVPFTAAFLVRGDFTVAAGAAIYSWLLLIAALTLVPLARRPGKSRVYVLVPDRE